MMKKILLLCFALVCTTISAQTTFVPDDGLEARLQQLGLDSGPLDDLVLTGNIDDLEDFDFGNFIVSDITGLQDFTALIDLRIDGAIADISPIENLTNLQDLVIRDVTDTNIDLSALVNLSFVNISDAAFTNLDFSNNPNLSNLTLENMTLESISFNNPLLEDAYFNYLNVPIINFSGCSALNYVFSSNNNSLISLDVSENTLLERIEFDDNVLLSYIDLSNNTALIDVRAEDNAALETIYIQSGNNTAIGQNFRVRDNPMLSCVEVDDVSWSNTFWGFNTNNFSGFSLNCTPANDDCAQATSITLAQAASGTTNSATNSTNSPGCEASGITILDIWYEFTAPTSGSVTMTINAPPLIGKIALYQSCADPFPIVCQANELSVTGLIPNNTYYLQVWLEADDMNRQGNPENENGGFILNVQDTSTLSVVDITTETNEIQLYPNPAKNQLTISSTENIQSVEIYDMSGKNVLKRTTQNTQVETVVVNQFASGLYMVRIKTNTGTATKKLIIN